MKGFLARLRAEPTVKAQMQVSVTEIVDEFYEDFATEESGRFWWWVQMVLLDPNEIICNDGGHELYRVPFVVGAEEADGVPEITFGEPVPVKVQYVDVAARADAVAAACTGIASVR